MHLKIIQNPKDLFISDFTNPIKDFKSSQLLAGQTAKLVLKSHYSSCSRGQLVGLKTFKSLVKLPVLSGTGFVALCILHLQQLRLSQQHTTYDDMCLSSQKPCE